MPSEQHSLAGVWDRIMTPGIKVQYRAEEDPGTGEVLEVPEEYDFNQDTLRQCVENFTRTFSERRLVMDDGNHRAAIPGHTRPVELARYSGMAAVWGGKVIAFWDQYPDLAPPDPAALLAALQEKFPRSNSADGLWIYRREVTPAGEALLPNMHQTSPMFSKTDRDEAGQDIGYCINNVSPVYVAHQNGTVLMSKPGRSWMEEEREDPSGDIDTDDDGDIDVEHFPLPSGLLRDAGIESDEDWDEIGTAPSSTMGRTYFNSAYDESKHDRAKDGKFAPKGGGGGGGGGGDKAKGSESKSSESKPKKSSGGGKSKDEKSPGSESSAPVPTSSSKPKSKGNWKPAETTPVPKRPDGKPGGGAGAQLGADVQQRLKDLGVNKLPAAHIAEVHISDSVHSDTGAHDGALLRWKDDKGKEQRAYSSEFDRRNAEKKWERVLTNRPKVDAQMDDLRSKAGDSPAHAAALLIALTGLRPGSSTSVKDTGHFGATTMQSKHVSFDDDGAHIQYVGKAGKVNKAHVTDPALVEALKKATDGKDPSAPVFKGVSSAKVAEALPKGVKTKDLRTLVATTDAERHLSQAAPPPPPVKTGDAKKDAAAEKARARAVVGILKQVSTQVSKQLNNTPAMARRSYIAPQVIRAWGEKHGLKPEWLGDSHPGAMSKITSMAHPASGLHAPRPIGEDKMEDEKNQVPQDMRKMACAKMGMPESASDEELMGAMLARMAAEPDPVNELKSAMAKFAESASDEDKAAMAKFASENPDWAENAAIHLKTGNVHDREGETKHSKFSNLPSDEKPGNIDGVKPNSASNFSRTPDAVVAQLVKRTMKAEQSAADAIKRLEAIEGERRQNARVAFSKWATEDSGRWDPEDIAGLNELVDDLGGDLDKARKHVERLPPRAAFSRYTQGGHPVGTKSTAAQPTGAAAFSKRTWEIYASDPECQALAKTPGRGNAAFAKAQAKARAEMPDNYESFAVRR